MRGTAAFEAHTVVRSVLATVLEDPDPPARMTALTNTFADAAGVDADLALELSFARYVSSYYWESQHDGDPTDVDRLRAAVTRGHPRPVVRAASGASTAWMSRIVRGP